MLQFFSILSLIVLIIISLIKQYLTEKGSKETNDLKYLEKIKEIKKDKNMKDNNGDNENKIDDFCNKHYKKIWIIFVIILFVTVIYKFGEIPTYIGVDEAGMVYDAINLAEYGTDRYMNSFPLYLTNFGSGQSSLCAYLVVLCIKLFGANMISYRLPTLLIYLMSVIVSYLFISKAKNKKLALLFTFLIITCPWNISNARMALDCNLYAGLFMLDLYLLNRAEKNYQYLLAGISIGVTLYTYCLSWITIPFFLLIWAIYMLYIKKIKFKQLVILGIPILLLALPLIYFLLLNYGIVKNTQIGIFSLPILTDFRSEQIHISNIFKTGLESLKTIFLADETIYMIYIPLFIIGYILEFKKAIKEIKAKQYGVSTIMIIAFTTLLIGLLTTRIPTPNKANVLYIPILYFVAVAILYISKDSKLILSLFIIMVLVLCVNYEYYYYTQRGTVKDNYYEDIYLMDITEMLEENEQTKDMEKYLLVFKCSPNIYNLIGAKISPEEYMSTVEEKYYGSTAFISKIAEYNYIYLPDELKSIDLEEKDYVFIISKMFERDMSILLDNGYVSKEYGDYYILTKNIEF